MMILHLFLKLAAFIYQVACWIGIAKPSVIVLIDGGICSQMYQYLEGLYLLRTRHYRVEYNTTWYAFDGRDANGNSVRNFDLLTLFPHLSFPVASPCKCKWYNRLFPYYGYSKADFNNPWWTVSPPVTLLGYWASPKDVWQPFRKLFRFNPREVLDERNLSIYNSIPTMGSVAVHVRRGDLSSWRPLYGNPVSENYFLRAVSYLLERVPDARFFFFSDDTDYVRNTLIPLFHPCIDYTIIDNDDAHGYMDLVLISRCQHQITSKGTLGKFGAMLGKQPGKMVIVERDDENIDILKGMNFDYVKL